MKTLKQGLSLLFALVLVLNAAAQVPQKINYQAVARDGAGNIMATHNVSIRFTIHDISPTGAIVYQETRSGIQTNQFGLFTCAIGAGTVVSGTFSAINWGTGDKFLQVELDPAAGTNYTVSGASQLLSVPYALYAANGVPGPAGAAGATGPAGAAGSQGPAGSTGANGATGATGMQGVTGAQGPAGPAGAQGLVGPTGINGATGAQGNTGATGVTGAQGPSGIQGIAGAQGAAGPQGQIGATGAQGLTGPTGADGIRGLDGATGAQGIAGPTGASGAAGAQGIAGPTGAQGVAGSTGATGAQGIAGSIGATGPQGIAGPTGAQGIAGATGANGPTGAQGVAGPSGANGATGAQGIAGPTGANGATGAQGIAGPTGAQGVTGNDGATGAQGIAGPTGANGATGAQGIAGPTGAQGIAGPTGANGATGAQGVAGPIGSNGATGAQGIAGSTGAQGIAGPTGSNGATGAQGIAGPTGANGATGAQGLAGPTGSNGATGAQGVAGPTGANGATGPTGPLGTASGDLSGTYPSPIVVGLQGYAVSNTAPTTNYILEYNGLSWTPMNPNALFWKLTGNSATTPSSSAIGTAANNNFIGTTDAKDFVVASNGLERMRVASGGNVGINTITPLSKLHVFSGISNTLTALQAGTANAIFDGGSGTANTRVIIGSNWTATGTRPESQLEFWNNANGGGESNSATIGTVSSQGASAGLVNGSLVFSTANAATTPTERMRITNTGTAGVGTSSPYTTLDVVGNIYTSIHANASEHDVTEQGSTYIGMKSGSTADGFAGMKVQVGAFGNAGVNNGSRIFFDTWGNSISTSRDVVSINEHGYLGVGTANAQNNVDVNGQVTIRGGSPAAGYVLTSTDANGSGSWQYAAKRYQIINENYGANTYTGGPTGLGTHDGFVMFGNITNTGCAGNNNNSFVQVSYVNGLLFVTVLSGTLTVGGNGTNTVTISHTDGGGCGFTNVITISCASGQITMSTTTNNGYFRYRFGWTY